MGKRMPNFSRGTDRGGYQGFLVRGQFVRGAMASPCTYTTNSSCQILANSGDAGLTAHDCCAIARWTLNSCCEYCK